MLPWPIHPTLSVFTAYSEHPPNVFTRRFSTQTRCADGYRHMAFWEESIGSTPEKVVATI
ncbi:hypothetical protein Pan181_28530 [Aeoliella mucimassa]|uniref:Uncharacterized protein n=1 Tax=Aeoliella mucimassa TaxID=2527972 RepID=A0A518API8_9BACT|nr:hypothetical protein Pan181_28530 [Aeoliella mucimassa]